MAGPTTSTAPSPFGQTFSIPGTGPNNSAAQFQVTTKNGELGINDVNNSFVPFVPSSDVTTNPAYQQYQNTYTTDDSGSSYGMVNGTRVTTPPPEYLPAQSTNPLDQQYATFLNNPTLTNTTNNSTTDITYGLQNGYYVPIGQQGNGSPNQGFMNRYGSTVIPLAIAGAGLAGAAGLFGAGADAASTGADAAGAGADAAGAGTGGLSAADGAGAAVTAPGASSAGAGADAASAGTGGLSAADGAGAAVTAPGASSAGAGAAGSLPSLQTVGQGLGAATTAARLLGGSGSGSSGSSSGSSSSSSSGISPLTAGLLGAGGGALLASLLSNNSSSPASTNSSSTSSTSTGAQGATAPNFSLVPRFSWQQFQQNLGAPSQQMSPQMSAMLGINPNDPAARAFSPSVQGAGMTAQQLMQPSAAQNAQTVTPTPYATPVAAPGAATPTPYATPVAATGAVTPTPYATPVAAPIPVPGLTQSAGPSRTSGNGNRGNVRVVTQKRGGTITRRYASGGQVVPASPANPMFIPGSNENTGLSGTTQATTAQNPLQALQQTLQGFQQAATQSPYNGTGGGYQANDIASRIAQITQRAHGLQPTVMHRNQASGFAGGGLAMAGAGPMPPTAQEPVVTQGGALPGPTGGQDDLIPAKLSHGEYVMDADTVSNLGDGNNAAGAAKLDQFREALRNHKRSVDSGKIPPRAKPIGDYMKRGK